MSNAYVVYTKMSGQICSTLDFRRAIAQALITLAKPPKVGRPLAARSPAQAKRRKITYSVPATIKLQNQGVHWPLYDGKRGHCEVCSKKGIESRPHCKCSTCNVYLCSNEKKNCYIQFHGVLS